MNKVTWIVLSLLLLNCGGGGRTVDPNAGKTGDVLLNQGLEFYKSHEYDKAKKTLKNALALKLSNDGMIAAYKHLAFIFAIQKDSQEAASRFLEAMKLDKNFTLDKGEMGNPYWTPAYEDAQKQFRLKALGSDDLFKTAKEYYEKRNYNESVKYFKAALAKYDLNLANKIQTYKYLAFIYSILQKTDEAKSAFRNAFKLDKNFELDKGEYGNPVWTPFYEDAKREIKK